MIRATILGASFVLLAIACGSPDAGPSSSAAAKAEPVAATTAHVFDEALTEATCDLLTTAMVASVAGVAAEAIEQREISGMCLYSWDGGNANIAFVKTYESADAARQRFENEHESMTGTEVRATMAEIGDGAREKLREDAAAGAEVPDPEAVQPVVGAMADSMDGGISFEAVPGLGDLAAFETTRHVTSFGGQTFVSYANKLDVLIGNLTFDVSFAFDEDPGEAKMYRDENVALARAVLEGLPG